MLASELKTNYNKSKFLKEFQAVLNKVGSFSIFLVKRLCFGNLKGPIKLGNSNTCKEVNLCLFVFMQALEMICHETEVFITVDFG